jgi:hypothetical protein
MICPLTAVTGTQVSVKAWSASGDFSQLHVVGAAGSGTAFAVIELWSSTLQMSLPISSTNYATGRDTFTR